MDQSATPLVDALQYCADRTNAAFYTPGHKRGQGTSYLHRRLFGSKVFRADLPELPELDNLFAPEGVISQAQALAAEAFGADRTWFLANGSTCGIEAAILATCGPTDKLILPRNVHSSAISGLILSGATPIYIEPDYSKTWNMPFGVSPQTVERAIAQHPTAKAVLLTSPTYQGLCSNIQEIARITHTHNIPLLIDEAHGPHFVFHPDLPTPALAAGADLVVQSAHKVLSAFTQAALLHIKGDKVDSNCLVQALQLTQSTSPSYLLLGSLDAARHQMATNGQQLLQAVIDLADRAAVKLSALPGIRILQPERDSCELMGDRTRLTVDVSSLGLTGFQADDILHNQFNVTAELPTLNHLTFIISLGNTTQDIDRLIQAFQKLCRQTSLTNTPYPHHSSLITHHSSLTTHHSSLITHHSSLITHHSSLTTHHSPLTTHHSQSEKQTILSPKLTPRQVFFTPSLSLPLSQAPGHICAETICLYPPGIPILLPGETITQSAIAHLQSLVATSAVLTGCQDSQMKTILVVDPSALPA